MPGLNYEQSIRQLIKADIFYKMSWDEIWQDGHLRVMVACDVLCVPTQAWEAMNPKSSFSFLFLSHPDLWGISSANTLGHLSKTFLS
jgi:hypothetical protein